VKKKECYELRIYIMEKLAIETGFPSEIIK
jgi:hypothetical protein